MLKASFASYDSGLSLMSEFSQNTGGRRRKRYDEYCPSSCCRFDGKRSAGEAMLSTWPLATNAVAEQERSLRDAPLGVSIDLSVPSIR